MPCLAMAADATAAPRTVESMLRDLKSGGIDVIYSSYLVPPGLLAPEVDSAASPLAAARAALASHGLALREIGGGRYVVVEAPQPAPAAADAPLEEISVYASRYAIDRRSLAEGMSMGATEIEAIPGSHDDALRALRALPGVATSVSAKPYIRGSLSEDVLVRYDGITLLDPYHLKNFQNLFSAIDPAAVDGVEVFSGGFPVEYGTRSGGVINITAPGVTTGYENRIAASLISAGVSSIGVADDWPLEWLGTIRRSLLDQLEPVEEGFGKPQFSDSLGRLKWKTERGAWTAGWLLLDDRLSFGDTDGSENAQARYRDEYFWVARDHRFDDALSARFATVFSATDRERRGTLDIPGVASGTLAERREFERIEVTNDWVWEAGDSSRYSFGAELSVARTDYDHARDVVFAPRIAAAFDRPPLESLHFVVRPRAVNYSLYAANRRQWDDLEAEFGVRLDAQDYQGLGQHTQVSPRLNVRYDFTGRTRLYASVGRFTQAQHIEEWRIEEAQRRADPALGSIHSIVGVTHESAENVRWSVEGYSKRWTRVSPYFDNQLNPLSLLPELAPDRIRVAPQSSEATGLELNVRAPLRERTNAWGSVSWARVADDFGAGDVPRSWDQTMAISSGISWQGPRLSLSALGGWHRGWPRTPFTLTPRVDGETGSLVLGRRNGARWGDYFTLDLRGAWNWRLQSGDLATTLEITNGTNRANACCSNIEGAAPGEFLDVEADHWLPVIFNLGFTYTWRRD